MTVIIATHLIWAGVALVAIALVARFAFTWLRAAKFKEDKLHLFDSSIGHMSNTISEMAKRIGLLEQKLSTLAERTDPMLASRSAIGRR